MGRSLRIRNRVFFTAFILIASVGVTASKCSSDQGILPLGKIPFPADNELTEAKIELGRKLFFDKRLSNDNTISCATCHEPARAFTDGQKTSRGVAGITAQRNAPTLLNAAYLPVVMFDGELKTLEMQVIVPVQEHSEMNSDMRELIAELRAVPEYQAAAKEIFNRDFDPWVLTRSISAFERTLISQNSAFDRFMNGDKKALSSSQKNGWKIFSEKLYCTQCHKAPHFTSYTVENNGLYADYGEDNGRFRITGKEESKGLFKVPSLRNIALTAPYMHNGELETLEAVLEHYKKGGAGHKNQSVTVTSFSLSENEQKDLLNFFQALTDTSYMRRFQ